MRSILRSDELAIFLIVMFFYALTLNTFWTTDHAASLLELEFSMWKNHSFILGSASTFDPHSVDAFIFNGNYYSALAPGVAFLGYPFASIGFILDGGNYSPFGNGLVMTELFIAIANSIACVFLFRLARNYFKPSVSLTIAFAYGLSTISWPFASMIFQHDLSAMFVLISAYLLVSFARNQFRGYSRVALAGLSMGLAFSVDYVDIALIPVFAVFFLFAMWKFGKRLLPMAKSILLLGAGMSIGFATIAAYNLVNFGSVFSISEQAYQHGNLLDQFSTPIYLGLEILLVSPYRGIIFYSPIVIAGLYGFWKFLKSRSSFDYNTKIEMILFLALFLAVLLPYSAWYEDTGGLSFGPRFIVPAIPFALIPLGYVLTKANRRTWVLVLFAYGIGVAVNGLGTIVTALGCYGSYWSYIPMTCSVETLSTGVISPFWHGVSVPYVYLFSFLIIGSAIIVPLMLVRNAMRTEGEAVRLKQVGTETP